MWNISRTSYYADWVTIPFLCLLAILTDVSYHGVTINALAALAVGAFIWTFAEYALHRWAFHRIYRKQHWIHHIRPAAFIGVPGWQTGGLFVVILGACWGSFGLDFGGGLFLGMAGGYFLYIWAHDKFHHSKTIPGTYWHRRWLDHEGHHRAGKEVNFGVVTPMWDVLLKTRP